MRKKISRWLGRFNSAKSTETGARHSRPMLLWKAILPAFFLATFANNVFAQGTHVQVVYQEASGSPLLNPILNPFGVQWSKSFTNSNGEIITVGHSSVPGQGEDVLLKKLDPDGNVIFSVTKDMGGANNDYGIDLYEMPNGDILVCGTTDNGTVNDYDAFILRFNSIGTFLNSYSYSGASGMNDIATAVTVHPNTGNILIAICNENTATSYDYRLVEIDPSTFTYLNSAAYDYANLIEVVLGIEIDASNGNILLIGGSQSSAITSAYAIAIFDGSSLGFISDSRTDLVGSPQDQPLAYIRDASNNTYITGKTFSGGQFNIKTVKILANNSIAWSVFYNPHNLDDFGNSIALDPTNGDVIVGGFVTKTNNIKEMVCLRYSNTNGSLISSHRQPAEDDSGDAAIKKVCTDASGNVYFVGAEKGKSGMNQTIVGKIKANGKKSWDRKISDATAHIMPSDILTEAGAVFVVTIIDAASDLYQTTMYEELELDTAKVDYGGVKYKDGELIVRFKPSALQTSAIDNHGKEFGRLSEFLTYSAYNTVLAALDQENICAGAECQLTAVKIFPGLSTTDSTSVSRLGEIVAIPDVWTALLLKFPSSYNVLTMNAVFNNALGSVVHYAEPNFLAMLHSTPSDTMWSKQYAVHTNTLYPGCDINVDEAWDVAPNGGWSHIRAGIIDTPIDWEHKEFNYDGTNPSSSKIIDGHCYTFGAGIKTLPHGGATGDWHATSVAGIMGAQRNNVRGISGIAGGNDSTGNPGITFYNPAVFDPGGSPTISPTYAPLSYISNAIFSSALDPLSNPSVYGAYKVNLQNHSWGLHTPTVDPGFWNLSNMLFREALHDVNRLNVTAIASRGNDLWNTKTYPANADDDWVICVTGSGTNGHFAQDTSALGSAPNAEYTSGWGGDVDVAAPSSGSLVLTLTTPQPASTINPQPEYHYWGRTSAAAAHVSGAVGLLMSYMNDATNANPYINLAPEDCEAIIQLTAVDIDSTGWDQLSGSGRLNVGKALRKVEKPYHDLLHFGTNASSPYSVSKTQIGSTVTVSPLERFRLYGQSTFISPANFKAKAFKITSTVFHSISPQDTIIAYWPRPSSSVTWNFYTSSGGQNILLPREKTKIINLNHTSAVLEGYVYQMFDMQDNPIGWWPVDTAYNQVGFGKWAEYSVLVRNYTDGVHTSLENANVKTGSSINIFPNPASGLQSLEFTTATESRLSVDLYDVMGRKIKTVYNGKLGAGKNIISHDVSSLPNSLYIYNIRLDGHLTSRKFIKQ